MLKSMGFGKSQPPSPGQTDSEPDTSNVSNDANQAKSLKSLTHSSLVNFILISIYFHLNLTFFWKEMVTSENLSGCQFQIS